MLFWNMPENDELSKMLTECGVRFDPDPASTFH
jgi:hypothetical protein